MSDSFEETNRFSRDDLSDKYFIIVSPPRLPHFLFKSLLDKFKDTFAGIRTVNNRCTGLSLYAPASSLQPTYRKEIIG